MEGPQLIPREIIEEIRDRNDIEEVVGSYVRLKRAGSNFSGLCPFHSEKTPSFTVFPATRSFYCFGCGAGGDVITFIMKSENLDYPEALEFLAKRAGIRIPEDPGKGGGTGVDRQRFRDMNREAAKFFHACLMDPVVGREGLRYLTEERKLSMATINHFGLGFAPNDFGMLRQHMNRLGYTDEELITGFLCGKSRKTGKPFDYFRNRVIFPIIDVSGNVIAFGGRVMDDSKPKYLNSSDTPVFKKSRNLFAFNFARKCCAEQMILCEGYMDVIALHAAGFQNAVATLGTAITEEQARLFAKNTKKVIITYDSDAAGQTAANRALRLLDEVGVAVRVLKLNGAKDPDEYIKKFGADKFRQVLGESRTEFEFRLDTVLGKYDVTIPDDRIRAANELCGYIANFSSPVEREVYIGQVAEKLGLTPDVLKASVERNLKSRYKEMKERESRNLQMSALNIGDRINPDAAKNLRAASAEETILGLLLLYPEYRDSVLSGKRQLDAEDFFTSFGRRVFARIMELCAGEGGYSETVLGETFTPDEMGRIQRMIRNRAALSENGSEVFDAAVGLLKNERLKREESGKGDLASSIERLRKKSKNQDSNT